MKNYSRDTVNTMIQELKVSNSELPSFLKELSSDGSTVEGYNDGSKGSINEPSALSELGTNIKKDVSSRISNIKQGLKEVPQAYNQEANAGVNDSKIAGVIGAGAKVLQQPLNIAGNIAGAGWDILFDAVSSIIPDSIKQQGEEAVKSFVQNNEGLQKFMSDISVMQQENLDLFRAAENVLNIAPTGEVKKVAGEGVNILKKAGKNVVEDTGKVINKTQKATEKLATVAKESITPTVSKEKAIGEVLQGTTKDIKKATEGLNLIDTVGIKTYKELDNTIGNKISTLAKTVDNELMQDTTKTLLDNLSIIKKTKAGGSVNINYVENALKQLGELYNKVGDVVSETDIKDLINLAKTQGLTKLEINDIARNYGQEFGEKAFGKTGEALTSVNAQLYENTRKGIKEVARNGLSSDLAKQADQAMSSLYNTRSLVKKNVEAVNKLMNRIEERGLLEKIGHNVSKYADILTGGGLRGFIGGLLPRGAGYKTLNALDLESLLERNLKIIKQASNAKTNEEIKTITSKLFTK